MINSSSRYATTPPFVDEKGVVSLCIRDRHVFSTRNAKYYVYKKGDTLDGVSFKQYGDSRLWWAILDSNPQYMSEMCINPGDVLIIPSYEEVVKVID